jgi:predicted nucleic acid-binding protein
LIISALNFPGNPSRILEMAKAGEIRLTISDDILNVVERVLMRPKFGRTQDQVDDVLKGLMLIL